MKIPISKLLNNTGQIEGVPTNPRTIDKADYQKLLKSIQERYWKFVNGGNEEGWENGTPAI